MKNYDLTLTVTLTPPDDGYRWSYELKAPKAGQKFFAPTIAVQTANLNYKEKAFFVQEKIRRTYDWSKTRPDVLIKMKNFHGFFRFGDLSSADSAEGWEIADICQASDCGECPVDADSCIVKARYANRGYALVVGKASGIDWDRVVSWKFERLVDGVEWS